MKKLIKIDWTKNKPTLSKKLNVFGSLLLFLSFTIQMFLYNTWDEKIKQFDQANRDFTEMTRTSLEYQNLYLGLQSQDSLTKQLYQANFIKAAAEKYRMGKIISTNAELVGSKEDAKKFVDNTNVLLASIQQVTDLNTLYAFVQIADAKIPENRKLKAEWMDKMNFKKKTASFFFLAFQILGSIMLVLGFRYQN
ncbi:hypothetical protein [Pedobacter sp. Leaf250]|uniref:hypothetical protein n=1 Tax=Pedobacter sp. Leaf250 TaxID=2876559 RepID=UPI001E579CDD|nr:hypothetical protein [Pedobacter sp. Leaf250]